MTSNQSVLGVLKIFGTRVQRSSLELFMDVLPRDSLIIAVTASLAFVGQALADHPGDSLDAEMTTRSKYFQVIDRQAPEFNLADRHGNPVTLRDHADKILILHFIYASCPDVCPLHAEKIAEVQDMINQTPMREMVQFLTITTDPKTDTAEALGEYGAMHGLDPVNWSFLTTLPDQEEMETRTLVQQYGHKFMVMEDGMQAHGVVTHVIDRGGRWAANFHGLEFNPVNLLLYVNGLSHREGQLKTDSDSGIWSRIRSLF